MAFTVTLYAFTKAPNSTAQPAGSGTDYSCVSNDNFNIIQPRIPLQIGAAANPTSYNYAKIAAWNRYYWIRSWAWEDGLWVAYMEVDALASWKSGIGGLSAYVLRSEAAWNGDIVDTLYPARVPTTTKTQINDPWNAVGFYVVGIVGESSTTCYYKMTNAEFTAFISYIFSDPYWTDVSAGTTGYFKPEFNPMQYITAVTYFPTAFPAGTYTSDNSIKLGYWDTHITGHQLQSFAYYGLPNITVSVPSHPQAATRGAYLDSEPYSKHTLTIPPYGQIPIPAHRVPSSRSIRISGSVDLMTGSSCIRIDTGDYENVIAIATAKVGVPLQLSQVQTKTVSAICTALSPGNLASSWLGVPSAIGNFLTNMMPQVQTTGMDGGLASIFFAPWALVSEFASLVDEDLADRGRPLCEVRQLSTLAGYQRCADVEVTLSCTREEEQMIKNALETGYYYE